MQIANSLQMNDWEIKKFLKVVLALQFAMWSVIALDAVGLQIPILRQLIGFIYLTFVPGILLLRILKIHSIDKTKFVLYSAGISIAFIMFAGAIINSLLPILKISQPISTLPIMATLTFFVIVLCVIAYIRDREFQTSEVDYTDTTNTKILLSPSLLFLLLLPFIAVFGTFFANSNQDNTLLLLLLLTIAVIVALIAFDKFFPAETYPLVIYIIAISILLHVSLISPYPYGWNIDYEYYCSELTVKSGYWDSSFSFTGVNSLLSIIMHAPIYSKVLGINIIWVFKAISPFIHSLLPLAIFAACREQMYAKKAFFSSFFFMSLPGFFITMSYFRREQIAYLFLALLVLVMLDNKLTSIQKSSLAILFVISLPVSHYGTSYLSLTIFLFGWILLLILNKQTIFNKKISKKISEAVKNQQKNASHHSILRSSIILVWLVFMLSWFMYIAGGGPFSNYVYVIENSFISLTDFFSPESKPEIIYETIGMKLPPAAVLGWIFRIVHYSTEVLIVVGFIALVFRPKIFKLKEEYSTLLIVTALFLFTVMFLPAMGKNWNTTRFYNFVLIMIAPLIVFGCGTIWKLTLWLIKSGRLPLGKKLTPQISNAEYQSHNRNNQIYLKFLVIAILIPYFLFNVGFIGEIAKNHVDIAGVPRSIPLISWNHDTLYFNEREISGAAWLANVSGGRSIVAGDANSNYLLSFWFPRWGFCQYIPLSKTEVPKSAYIYLRTWNIEKREVAMYNQTRAKRDYISFDDIAELRYAINIRNKIYDNGGAPVYYR